jgi:hypothetical protein
MIIQEMTYLIHVKPFWTTILFQEMTYWIHVKPFWTPPRYISPQHMKSSNGLEQMNYIMCTDENNQMKWGNVMCIVLSSLSKAVKKVISS